MNALKTHDDETTTEPTYTITPDEALTLLLDDGGALDVGTPGHSRGPELRIWADGETSMGRWEQGTRVRWDGDGPRYQIRAQRLDLADAENIVTLTVSTVPAPEGIVRGWTLREELEGPEQALKDYVSLQDETTYETMMGALEDTARHYAHELLDADGGLVAQHVRDRHATHEEQARHEDEHTVRLRVEGGFDAFEAALLEELEKAWWPAVDSVADAADHGD